MKTTLRKAVINMFSFLTSTFMIYALIISLCLGLAAALISPYLVLNNQSMIADGLSHVAFTGIAFGLLLVDQPLYVALPIVILAAILITYLGNLKMINHDSAIGVVSAFSMAVGLIAISVSSGFNRSIESLLVGSILTVSPTEVIFAAVLLILIITFVLVFYRPLLSMTYDENFAKVSGVKNNLLKYFLSVITASFITIGISTAGMLLISAFIIFPALIASQLAKNFRQTITFGLIASVLSVFAGITFAYHLDIPVGSAIIVLYTILLVFSLLYRKFRRVI